MVSPSPIPEYEPDSPDADLQLHIYVRSLAPTVLSNLKGGITKDVGWTQAVIFTLLF